MLHTQGDGSSIYCRTIMIVEFSNFRFTVDEVKVFHTCLQPYLAGKKIASHKIDIRVSTAVVTNLVD